MEWFTNAEIESEKNLQRWARVINRSSFDLECFKVMMILRWLPSKFAVKAKMICSVWCMFAICLFLFARIGLQSSWCDIDRDARAQQQLPRSNGAESRIYDVAFRHLFWFLFEFIQKFAFHHQNANEIAKRNCKSGKMKTKAQKSSTNWKSTFQMWVLLFCCFVCYDFYSFD